MSAFNDQNLSKLAANSRFRQGDEILDSPSRNPKWFDIKGNTYKSTLIPRETVETRASVTTTEGFLTRPVTPNKPKGYLRSGSIIFNNIA